MEREPHFTAPGQIDADAIFGPHRCDEIASDPMCDYCDERHEGLCEDDGDLGGEG